MHFSGINKCVQLYKKRVFGKKILKKVFENMSQDRGLRIPTKRFG